jgi:hypothetical protein
MAENKLDKLLDIEKKVLTDFGKFILADPNSILLLSKNTKFDALQLENLFTNPKAHLYADDFYKIITATKNNIEHACSTLFKIPKLNVEVKNLLPKSKQSSFANYVKRRLVDKGFTAKYIGASRERLSKLLSDPKKRPYASEVYRIAVLFEENPLHVFEELFGAKEE